MHIYKYRELTIVHSNLNYIINVQVYNFVSFIEQNIFLFNWNVFMKITHDWLMTVDKYTRMHQIYI